MDDFQPLSHISCSNNSLRKPMRMSSRIGRPVKVDDATSATLRGQYIQIRAEKKHKLVEIRRTSPCVLCFTLTMNDEDPEAEEKMEEIEDGGKKSCHAEKA